MKFGKSELARDASVLASTLAPALTLNQFQETAMPDAEAVESRKAIEKKSYPQIVNLLKKSVGAITITKRILNLRVNLTIGKLLALAPAIKNSLQKLLLRTRPYNFGLIF